ncbi:centrosomal protein of 135 kDa-like [Pollicipes pollicipes]|uniref:centrosomal protein of 135 kDa-like n=1 Tax=Pollicipes pollicipes TaxID=41117 RepID=UPI00188576DB|nr:centrosomal protein of 135 kDa-like [Pollicipes pollicipes]
MRRSAWSRCHLAEKLLADLLQTPTASGAKHGLETATREDAEGRVCVEPYRQDNARLCQELSALHQEIIKSQEQHQTRTKELRADIRRLSAENEDLRFLAGQYRKQAEAAEQRLFRLLEQQEQPQASVTVTGAYRLLQMWHDHPAGSQVKSRDSEIRRLTGQLEGGRPYRAVLADADTKENDMSRANVPYTELKKTNVRLEKQLKETLHSQHEAMQRAMQLAQKNTALKRELEDLDRIVHVLDEDRSKAVRTSQQQLKQEQTLVKDAANELDEAVEALVETMRQDRKATQERLDRVMENEKQLVLELDRLSRQKTNTARIPDKTQKLIQSLEEQRDYFKAQVDELIEQLQKKDRRAVDSDGNRLQTEAAELRRQLADCERQLAGSAAQLDVKTNESEQLRHRLDEALRSLHRLSDSESAATMASAAQLESLVRTLEQERSLATGDYHRVDQERKELRHRLKVATETQLADRVKMESRIAELEALIGAAETDRTVQHSQTASHRALISSLEAQVKNLQNSLSGSQAELSRVMTKNTKMKTFVDRGESSLKDCENKLIKTTSELEVCQTQSSQLQRQCADLRATVDELQREARRQTKVIEQVIRERDKFQNDVDDKTELLDEHCQQLEKCTAHIGQLESTITNLTADLAPEADLLEAPRAGLRSRF